jgi:hypothetical protein
MTERILAQWETPSWRPAVCRKFSRCEYFGNRTPDSGGGEVGETVTPAFAANDGPETTRRTVFVCRFLQREKKSDCVLLYVGGVKVSKKIREYEVGADEFLEFFVVTLEEGRHELVCPPPVDVSHCNPW